MAPQIETSQHFNLQSQVQMQQESEVYFSSKCVIPQVHAETNHNSNMMVPMGFSQDINRANMWTRLWMLFIIRCCDKCWAGWKPAYAVPCIAQVATLSSWGRSAFQTGNALVKRLPLHTEMP